MNKYSRVFLILLIHSFCLSGAAQWTWQMPKPTGEAIHDVGYFTPDRYLFVGSNGLILKLNDGFSFDTLSSGTEEQLYSIYCVDDHVGWIGSNGEVVLKTEDGGLTWEKAWEKEDAEITSFYAFDVDRAILSEKPGELNYTVDGGQSWETMSTNVPNSLSELNFLDSLTGFAVVNSSESEAHGMYDSIVVNTADGGYTWDTIPILFHHRVNFIEVYGGNEVWIGSLGFLYHSNDFGLSWDSIELPDNDNWQQALSITFHDQGNFWLLCSRQGDWSRYYSIYHSSDNGQSFQKEMEYNSSVYASDCNEDLFALNYTNNRCWAIGYPGLIYSIKDVDSNWTRQGKFLGLSIDDIFFYDDQNGFGVGELHSFIRTTDGGENWEVQNNLPESDNYKVYFLDQDRGFVINSNGGLNRTVDGGATWDTVYDETHRLTSIDFEGNTGWILGNDARIYNTKDAGDTWKLLALIPTNETMEDMQFTSASDGIVVGFNGQIWKTSDGGASWDLKYNKVGLSFWDVYFVSGDFGWAISSEGIICRSENGGENWSVIDTIADSPIHDFGFVTDKIGYLVSDMGRLYRTKNGGLSWTIDQNFSFFSGSLAIVDHDIWLASTCLILHKTEEATGVEEHQSGQDHLVIYPNPAVSSLNINCESAFTSYTILDLQGKLLKTGWFSPTRNRSVGVSELVPGLYFIRLKTDERYISSRFVKMK